MPMHSTYPDFLYRRRTSVVPSSRPFFGWGFSMCRTSYFKYMRHDDRPLFTNEKYNSHRDHDLALGSMRSGDRP